MIFGSTKDFPKLIKLISNIFKICLILSHTQSRRVSLSLFHLFILSCTTTMLTGIHKEQWKRLKYRIREIAINHFNWHHNFLIQIECILFDSWILTIHTNRFLISSFFFIASSKKKKTMCRSIKINLFSSFVRLVARFFFFLPSHLLIKLSATSVLKLESI